MERKVRMILIPLGLLSFAAAYFLIHYASVSADVSDFLRGFGLSVIIFALLFQAKWKRSQWVSFSLGWILHPYVATMSTNTSIDDFLAGKSDLTKELFYHFVDEYNKIGMVTIHLAKTMIGVANEQKRIAWVTQLGKNFVHIVFPFKQPYPDNLCFTKIAQVPGDAEQFNHHFRMLSKEDINDEVKSFMKLAYQSDKTGDKT